MQSRYYDPAIGRFLNADSYASTGQGIIGNNMFVYCGNNPVANVDTGGNRYEAYNADILSGYASIATAVALRPAFDAIAQATATAVNQTITAICDLIKETATNIKQAYESRTVSKNIGDITSSYGKYQCDKCAESVVDYLKKNNRQGSIISISFQNSRGYIWSDIANTTISQNGFHVGVEYKGIVYCNIHPLGLPEAQWVNDFYGTGEKLVTKIPF